MRAAAALLVVLAAGCGASQPRIVTFAGQLPESVVPLAWLEGRWERNDRSAVENWSAAGPALFGVRVGAAGGATPFEVLTLDAPSDKATHTVLTDGSALVLPVVQKGKTWVVFGTNTGDMRVRYERKRGQLVVTTTGARKEVARYTRRDPAHADELDEADRLWGAADEHLTVWARGQALSGADAAAEVSTFGALERHVVASAVEAGDLGFTIGLYRSADARQRGGYIALWRKQADGSWRLRFLTARATA